MEGTSVLLPDRTLDPEASDSAGSDSSSREEADEEAAEEVEAEEEAADEAAEDAERRRVTAVFAQSVAVLDAKEAEDLVTRGECVRITLARGLFEAEAVGVA